MFAAVAILSLSAQSLRATPTTTEFTYQGQLKDGGNLPNAVPYDFQFKLFDAATSPPGVQIGPTICKDNVQVANGLFTVVLDFGASPFVGDARWLEIGVRPGNVNVCTLGAYTTLSPRQPLTAAPYALYALDGPGVGGNTLDQAYDQGGPGAGRIITADSGAVMINGTGGLAVGANNLFVNPATSFVGVNRNTSVGSAEYFGIQAPASGTNYGGMYIRTTSATAKPFYGYAAGTETAWTYLDGSNGDWVLYNGGPRITVSDTGNVGIPATVSDVALNVTATGGNVGVRVASVDDDGIQAQCSGTGNAIQGSVGFLGLGTGNAGRFANVNSNNMTPALYCSTASTGLALQAAGRVGINTTYVNPGVMLAVNGKVLCEELEVQLSQDWPDYVFDERYDLMPLEQVDAFVKEHKHLPGLPSAAQVSTDGINVGRMQTTLLEKVEELTLHVIEMNKRIESLQRENNELRAKLADPSDQAQ